MKKRIFILPFLIMAVAFVIIRAVFAHFFASLPASARAFSSANILLVMISVAVPAVLPEIAGAGEGKKPFRRALCIFSAVYAVIALLLFLGIPSSALRVDVGCLVLFMISFLYCLNVYLAMMWLHRLPAKKESASDLQSQIVRSLELLAQRADSLDSEFEAEKARILKLPELGRSIQEAKAIEAAVMEQNIMSRISAFTAEYEKVLSGAKNESKKFTQTLSELESLVQQRTKMK